MRTFREQFNRFVQEESAPTFLEYGLLVILIAMVVVVAATTFGTAVMQMFQGVPSAP